MSNLPGRQFVFNKIKTHFTISQFQDCYFRLLAARSEEYEEVVLMANVGKIFVFLR